MKKTKYILIFMIVLFCFGNNNVTATITPSEIQKYKKYDFVIDSYDININVNENNTLDVTETIEVYFNKERHGIYRTLPLKNKVVKPDGKTSIYNTQVTNINVNNEYTTTETKEDVTIQIGSIHHTLLGKQKYILSYTYNLGKDHERKYDELYYNFLGNEWDTVIGGITFKITMPKEFDKEKIGFTSGMYGEQKNNNIEYTVEDRAITGRYNGVLNPNENITIRCELKNGYFKNASLQLDQSYILLFSIPFLSFMISIVLWFVFGKNKMVVETVEFYPPKELNSLELQAIYNKNADKKGVTSLLIYLANKGYLKVEEYVEGYNENIVLSEEKKNKALVKIKELEQQIQEEKIKNPNSPKIKIWTNTIKIYQDIDKPINYGLSMEEERKLKSNFGKKEKKIRFIKLKDYDGNNEIERLFLEKLFEGKEIVNLEDLENHFYMYSNQIINKVNRKDFTEKYYEPEKKWLKFAIYFLILVNFIFITCLPEYGTNGKEGIKGILLIETVFFFIPTIFSLLKAKGNKEYNIPLSIFLLLLITIYFLNYVSFRHVLKNDSLYLKGVIFGIVWTIGMFLCAYAINLKRTKEGNTIYGKIKGFKTFLETVEKEKLEAMVIENPNYFYDILPFTYVLGISSKWIKKFETIHQKEVEFDIYEYRKMIDRMNELDRTLHTKPSTYDYTNNGNDNTHDSSSNNGKNTGGGMSGGGFGGGGGGSW